MAGLDIDPATVETNILFVTVTRPGRTAAEVCAALKQKGILCNASAPQRFRLVTHYHVETAHVPIIVAALEKCMAE